MGKPTAIPPRVGRKAIRAKPPNNVSGVTSGKKLFVTGDGRGAWGRRFKDLIYLHCQDLGGLDSLSEFQLSLVRRVATLECELERMEAELAEGRPVDIDVYARTASHLRWIVETLGLERVQKEVGESLADIVKRHAEERAARTAEQAETVEATILPSDPVPLTTVDANDLCEAIPAVEPAPSPTLDVNLADAFDPAVWGDAAE